MAGGEVLEYLAPEVWNSYQATGPEDFVAAVARVRSLGLPYLPLSRSLSDDLSNLAAGEAAKAGVSTVWETMTVEGLVRAVTRGAGLLEGTPGPEPLRADLLGLLGKTKRFWIPNGGVVPADPPADLLAARAKGAAAAVRALRRAGRSSRRLRAGRAARFTPSSKASWPRAPRRSRRWRSRLSMPPARSASRIPEPFKGMRADLVLLEADPSNDIRNAARVFRVIRNGTVFDPGTLGPNEEEPGKISDWLGGGLGAPAMVPPRLRISTFQYATSKKFFQSGWMRCGARSPSGDALGLTGWRRSFIPASSGRRFPFRTLHGRHAQTMFSQDDFPPRESGVT